MFTVNYSTIENKQSSGPIKKKIWLSLKPWELSPSDRLIWPRQKYCR